MEKHYLGYSEQDLKQSPYATYYNPNLNPMQQQVVEAISIGGQAEELFPPVGEASSMQEPGYWPVETGFTRAADTSIRVFCLTHMPDVSPQMWDWWFGWHGCEAQRYKLWHPKAHIDARWADGHSDERYLGRTSLIKEYVGSKLIRGGISFIPPTEMGFDETKLNDQGEVAVCAHIGVPGTPVRGGWLCHQVRPVAGGSEMRSRMWLGGDNGALGSNPGLISKGLIRLLRPVIHQFLPDPTDLLVHNAQEMSHLASFLPKLYVEFGSTGASK